MQDFIARLKNAYLARRRTVVFSYSKINVAAGKILVKNGFIEDIKEELQGDKKILVSKLRYEKRKPVVTDVVLVSKPSLRIYRSVKQILRQKKSLGIEVFSTNIGILTGKEAKKQGVGGELLFRIW